MKYLLPLTLIASAAWAAARTPTHPLPASSDNNASAGVARASDPPWLTGALVVQDEDDEENAEGDDPHAGVFAAVTDDSEQDDDPHAGLFADGAAEMGMCTRDDDSTGSDTLEAETDPHEPTHQVAPGVALPAAPLARSSASNGHSVAELHAQRVALAEQTVRVRGTIVKRTDGILGQSYVHLRDGTGSEDRDDDDLTVTTTEEFEIGETVEIEGRLLIDQDLGLGYRYAALIASATRIQP